MKLLALLIASTSLAILLRPHMPSLYVSGLEGQYNEANLVQNTPSPTPTPKRSEVVAYIAKTFESEGPQVMVKAIECFYSESGLRYNAVNTNTNGTHDGGVAQINDVHGMTLDERLDYQKNIDKAHEIYKSRGNFSAWYGTLCK